MLSILELYTTHSSPFKCSYPNACIHDLTNTCKFFKLHYSWLDNSMSVWTEPWTGIHSLVESFYLISGTHLLHSTPARYWTIKIPVAGLCSWTFIIEMKFLHTVQLFLMWINRQNIHFMKKWAPDLIPTCSWCFFTITIWTDSGQIGCWDCACPVKYYKDLPIFVYFCK